MNLYDEFYPVAVEMLDDFGASGQLSRTGQDSSTYDPISDTYTSTGPTVVVVPVRTVVTEMEWQDEQGREVTRSTAILLTKPQLGDTLTLGDLTLTVGKHRVIAPQGQAILYLAEVS